MTERDAVRADWQWTEIMGGGGSMASGIALRLETHRAYPEGVGGVPLWSYAVQYACRPEGMNGNDWQVRVTSNLPLGSDEDDNKRAAERMAEAIMASGIPLPCRYEDPTGASPTKEVEIE